LSFEVETDFPSMLQERQDAFIQVIKMLSTVYTTLNSISEWQDAEVSSAAFVFNTGVLIPDIYIYSTLSKVFSFRITMCCFLQWKNTGLSSVVDIAS
jgi:hypothetical protein